MNIVQVHLGQRQKRHPSSYERDEQKRTAGSELGKRIVCMAPMCVHIGPLPDFDTFSNFADGALPFMNPPPEDRLGLNLEVQPNEWVGE